jgi:hypothetical protein
MWFLQPRAVKTAELVVVFSFWARNLCQFSGGLSGKYCSSFSALNTHWLSIEQPELCLLSGKKLV